MEDDVWLGCYGVGGRKEMGDEVDHMFVGYPDCFVVDVDVDWCGEIFGGGDDGRESRSNFP